MSEQVYSGEEGSLTDEKNIDIFHNCMILWELRVLGFGVSFVG